MKWILILGVIDLGIFAYEAYWPIPDPDQEQFDKYIQKAYLYEQTLGIPAEISILFKIDSAKKAEKLAKKYNNCRGQNVDVWIKNIFPRLNWGEVKKIKKWQMKSSHLKKEKD